MMFVLNAISCFIRFKRCIIIFPYYVILVAIYAKAFYTLYEHMILKRCILLQPFEFVLYVVLEATTFASFITEN